jgi:histidyl-tRNA synthetase
MFDDLLEIRTLHLANDVGNFSKRIENNAIGRRIDELEQLLARIEAFGLSNFVTIGFGIVRGLAYYTGFVFKIFERSGQSCALAGGGRYNNLMKKLGYSDVPAVGFAIGDATLGNLLKENNLTPKLSKNIHCFIVYSSQTEGLALGQAMIHRGQRINTDYYLSQTSLRKQLKMTAQANVKYAIIFGEDEVKVGCAMVKGMSSGNEIVVEVDRLIEVISR